MRDRVQMLIVHPLFERVVIGVIVLNALVLGIETFPEVMKRHSSMLEIIDQLFVAFFVAELALRIYAQRLAFFHWKEGWNWFDFLIVSVTLLPFAGNVSALRALRILRALRLVSAVPSFRQVVNGIGRAVAGFASVLGVLVLIHYVAAVMGSKLFGEKFPDTFGDLFTSLFTLFQVMTLDAWSDVARPVIETYPWSWMFFVGFIAITVFLLLSIIVGIAANAMQPDDREERMRAMEDKLDQILRKLS